MFLRAKSIELNLSVAFEVMNARSLMKLLLISVLQMSVFLPSVRVDAKVEGDALTTCQTFARELYREVKEIRQLQLINDAKARLERSGDKVGSQEIDSELLGNGRLMTKKGWKNFSYLCLLENERKAVYFRILNNISF